MHGAPTRSLLKQHLRLLTNKLLVEGVRLLVRQLQQAFAAQLLVTLRHHIVNLQGRRAGTLAVGEYMQLGHGQLFQKLVGLLKTLWRLAPAAHHHIHADKCIRHHLLDSQYLIGKQLAVVMSVHQLQHRVAAALQGDMEMRHKRPTLLAAIVYQLVAQQVGLQAADTIAADALHLVQGLHQVEEALARGLAEVANVHARQHNLLATLCGSLLGLSHQRSYRWVATESAGVGNGAVGAEIVATILCLQEIARAVAARARGRKSLDVLRLLPLPGCFVYRDIVAVYKPLREELDEVGLLVGTQHQAHALNLAHRLSLQLRVAARHHHKGARVLAHQSVNGLPAFLVSHIRHRTSVNQADVCLFALGCRAHTHLLKHLTKGRGLREVQFAPQREVFCRFALKGRSIYHILFFSTMPGPFAKQWQRYTKNTN